MKSIKLASLLALSLAAVASFGAQSDVKHKITDAYAKMDAMTVKMDGVGLTKLLMATSTPDCVFIEEGMTHTRKEMLDRMKVSFASLSSITGSTSHIDSWSIGANSLTTHVSSSLSAVTKAGQDGKTHRVKQTSKSVDLWVKVGGAWKLKSTKDSNVVGYMDGNKVKG